MPPLWQYFSRLLNVRSKCQRRVSVAVTGESGEAGCDHRTLVDRRLVAALEVTQQPARGDALMPTRILARDQDRQLERVAEVERR
jgi:hypothetical protein